MKSGGDYTNHLAQETSPYLLQHAHNPVDWHPWGAEALAKARAENKPILLSVGYSACHWCHVMAHECFEDAGVAAVMNDLFVNIKVDREERPDLDKIYQTAHSLLTQRNGGWPLTMFLTPDGQIPFFGGTYFPKEPRHGLPGFVELMQRVVGFYTERQSDIAEQNDALLNALASLAAPAHNQGHRPGRPDALPLDVARNQLEKQFDATHGGFGRAPKFPHPTSLERLLRHWSGSHNSTQVDAQALHMATYTLEHMALGGIYDQLGGGFCRYSVDDYWMIPHFEKMLYDNGPLLALYAQAHAATGNPLFARIAHETAAWVMREMQSAEGGFYSTLDADSEGEEGKFYVWTRAEVRTLLGNDYELFARRFGLDREPNFEGHYHLHVFVTLTDLAHEFKSSEADIAQRLDAACAKLVAVRSRRIWPGRDEKILTSWNGLMIRGLAIAARHLERPDYAEAATRAVNFIRHTLWRDGRLLATYKDGRAHLNAYLDDYVFLIDALLELLQVRWRDDDLRFAVELAEIVLEHFADPNGGFFFTADDHETLIQRPKPVADDALPSGNGIAASVFGRLGHLLGELRYVEAAERTLTALWPVIEQNAYACTALLLAAEDYLFPGQTVVLRGNDETLDIWRRHCAQPYAPRRSTFAIPDDAIDPPGLLRERRPQGEAVAYVCTGTQCAPPAMTLTELDTLLM
ncbi:MAG: thioredoxin domain-containing protein [Gammaproteobacteria bacterium]|nr:thioredoxin domain-containing protein [Gammaproteobacteria bacterium]